MPPPAPSSPVAVRMGLYAVPRNRSRGVVAVVVATAAVLLLAATVATAATGPMSSTSTPTAATPHDAVSMPSASPRQDDVHGPAAPSSPPRSPSVAAAPRPSAPAAATALQGATTPTHLVPQKVSSASSASTTRPHRSSGTSRTRSRTAAAGTASLRSSRTLPAHSTGTRVHTTSTTTWMPVHTSATMTVPIGAKAGPGVNVTAMAGNGTLIASASTTAGTNATTAAITITAANSTASTTVGANTTTSTITASAGSANATASASLHATALPGAPPPASTHAGSSASVPAPSLSARIGIMGPAPTVPTTLVPPPMSAAPVPAPARPTAPPASTEPSTHATTRAPVHPHRTTPASGTTDKVSEDAAAAVTPHSFPIPSPSSAAVASALGTAMVVMGASAAVLVSRSKRVAPPMPPPPTPPPADVYRRIDALVARLADADPALVDLDAADALPPRTPLPQDARLAAVLGVHVSVIPLLRDELVRRRRLGLPLGPLIDGAHVPLDMHLPGAADKGASPGGPNLFRRLFDLRYLQHWSGTGNAVLPTTASGGAYPAKMHMSPPPAPPRTVPLGPLPPVPPRAPPALTAATAPHHHRPARVGPAPAQLDPVGGAAVMALRLSGDLRGSLDTEVSGFAPRRKRRPALVERRPSRPRTWAGDDGPDAPPPQRGRSLSFPTQMLQVAAAVARARAAQAAGLPVDPMDAVVVAALTGVSAATHQVDTSSSSEDDSGAHDIVDADGNVIRAPIYRLPRRTRRDSASTVNSLVADDARRIPYLDPVTPTQDDLQSVSEWSAATDAVPPLHPPPRFGAVVPPRPDVPVPVPVAAPVHARPRRVSWAGDLMPAAILAPAPPAPWCDAASADDDVVSEWIDDIVVTSPMPPSRVMIGPQVPRHHRPHPTLTIMIQEPTPVDEDPVYNLAAEERSTAPHSPATTIATTTTTSWSPPPPIVRALPAQVVERPE
ncbi:hypothetical protein AMAG_15023 [Allomyces macrogynus ATCC 38327]|uniref:Uncharacterized protein n=1 Tax=Allomyces macrogynus (strain ATCC 38327) TaxID=578462 RepID=A0A0L0T8P6_ALLM3|nr:hypothetical protein AMAG_15023 [Allomyces macrogynus ATCC 38327]|eukprot:KNE70934.1 hypothetical protein AMAG_15023 [Allomyces macrogynus ATCC 38327]